MRASDARLVGWDSLCRKYGDTGFLGWVLHFSGTMIVLLGLCVWRGNDRGQCEFDMKNERRERAPYYGALENMNSTF